MNDTPERTLLAASRKVQQTPNFIEGGRVGANGEGLDERSMNDSRSMIGDQ
jgi:hypothetical protein